MIAVQEIRRGAIMAQKRLNLLKYNLSYQLKNGGLYNMERDMEAFNHKKVMNVVDFRNRKELYLLDLQSDATEYGG